MGFEINRFECLVDEELLCSICKGVLDNPLQIVTCEHVFCSKCIHNWISIGNETCPLDREPIKKDQMKTPRIVTNLLAKLNIKCDFASKGCPSMIKLESLAQHCIQCEFNPDKRIRCEKGCGLTLLRNELTSHNCMEELHNFVRQQRNEIRQQKDKMEEMNQEISELKVNHLSIINNYNQIKKLIEKLELKVDNENRQTKIVKKGIEKCAEVWKRLSDYEDAFSDVIDEIKNEKINKQVFVRFKGRKVQVDPYELISNIKSELKTIFGIGNGKLKLFHGINELADHHTLAHYKLLETNNSELMLSIIDEIQILIKVRVMNTSENVKHPWLTKNLLPKTIALKVDRNQTIAHLKSEIKLICDIQSENVLLTLGNESLEDQNQLLHYGITNGDTINYYAHL